MNDERPPATKRREFDAFVSYRREDPDRTWAIWLQTALETYRPPRSLVRDGSDPRPRLRVFRDETETSASASLCGTLEDALAASRHLIVVASPRAAGSRWVDAEVRWFVEHGRRDRIFVLLVEGDPATAFPPALRGPDEPLAADVRAPQRPSLRARRRDARLRLLAPLLGVDFDALVRRDAVRRRRARLVVGAFAVALLAGAGALVERLWSAQATTTATQGTLARTEGRLDATRAARDAEATARRDAEVGLALTKAREHAESGKPSEALRSAWAALRADPTSVGARIVLGRLLRERSALLAGTDVSLTNVREVFRTSADSDVWVVSGEGASFTPTVRVVGGDGLAIGPVVSGAFASPDSSSVDRDGRSFLALQPPSAGVASLTLWTRGEETPRWTLSQDASSLAWAALSPDGRRLAYALLGEPTTEVVDVERGAALAPVSGSSAGGAFLGSETLALGRFPSGIAIVNVRSGATERTIETGTDRAGAVVAVRDDVLIAASHPNGPLLVDARAGRVTARWAWSIGRGDVSFGTAGARFVAESDGDASVRVGDVESGRLLREVPRGSGGDSVVSFSARPGHREIATQHLDGTVRLWSIDGTQPPIAFVAIPAPSFGDPSARPTPSPFDGTGTRMVTLLETGRLIVWDVEGRSRLLTMTVSPDAAAAGLSRTGDEAHVVTTHGRYERWSLAAASEPRDASIAVPGQTSVACASADGALVARASLEGHLTIVRIRDGAVVSSAEWTDEWITSLTFTTAGTAIVVAPRYREPARVVDVASGTTLRVLDVRRRPPETLLDTSATDYVRLLSLAGDEVLSYGTNGATVWSTTTAEPLAALAPSGVDADALVGEDGRTVIVTTEGGAVVWRRGDDGRWARAPSWGESRGPARWIGISSSSGLAARHVAPARIETVPWREGAAAGTLDLVGPAPLRIERLADGRLATIEADGALLVRDPTTGSTAWVVRPAERGDLGPFSTATPERDEPTDRHVAVHPGGAWAAFIDRRGDLQLADAVRGHLLARWSPTSATATIVAGDGGATLVRVGLTEIDLIRLDPETRDVDALAPVLEQRLR